MSDANTWYRAEDEAERIRQTVLEQEDVSGVEVWSNDEGRWIEVTLTGGMADSLSVSGLVDSEEAEQRADSLARTIKSSYDAFQDIARLEVEFAKKAALGPVGASTQVVVEFDGEDLQEL